jgi:hypothetical protein
LRVGPVIVLSAIDATLGRAILLFKQGIRHLEALMFMGAGIEEHQRAGTDDVVLKAIGELGWKTLVVWECETKNIQLLKEKLQCFLVGEKDMRAKKSFSPLAPRPRQPRRSAIPGP